MLMPAYRTTQVLCGFQTTDAGKQVFILRYGVEATTRRCRCQSSLGPSAGGPGGDLQDANSSSSTVHKVYTYRFKEPVIECPKHAGCANIA